MKMDASKKKDLLLKNFDIIKSNITENYDGVHSAITKMFEIDVDTAVEMWAYILTKHESYVKEDGFSVAGWIVKDCSKILGKRKACDIIIENPILKHALFSLASNVLIQADLVEMLIKENDLVLADELLQLLYLNQYKENSWYDVIFRTMSQLRDKDVSNEAYELLDVWCDKVTDIQERAKLSIKMMEFIE